MAAIAVRVVPSRSRAKAQGQSKAQSKAAPRGTSRDYHFVQEIDNSRIRRISDPRELRAVLLYFAIGVMAFAAVLAFAGEQFAIIKDGYDISDLQARRETLIEANKTLRAEAATLRNPERVSNYALANLGLTQPKEGQVVRMESPIPAGAGEAILARLR
jgi:hypothetical protein